MAKIRLCSVDGCCKTHYSHGYCIMHLRRVQKHGSTEKPVDTKRTGAIKECVQCGAEFYCQKHYLDSRKFCSVACADAAKVGPKTPLPDRFWAKVDIKDTSECWEWHANRNPNGYGIITIQGKTRTAHRVAYQLVRGEIAEGLCVRHKCDNPPCVNPAHLELGTHQDNMRDMVERGRSSKVGPRGDRARATKLSEQDVLTIRRRAAAGVGAKIISQDYPVSLAAISMIINRKNWAWLKPE